MINDNATMIIEHDTALMMQQALEVVESTNHKPDQVRELYNIPCPDVQKKANEIKRSLFNVKIDGSRVIIDSDYLPNTSVIGYCDNKRYIVVIFKNTKPVRKAVKGYVNHHEFIKDMTNRLFSLIK